MFMQKIDCKIGLTEEQVQERKNNGLINYNDLPKTKTIKKIITDNIFNYFSFCFGYYRKFVCNFFGNYFLYNAYYRICNNYSHE